MNILKNRINQREYAYLNVLLMIAITYVSNFGHAMAHYLNGSAETHIITSKIIFFLIFGILSLLLSVYIVLTRVNDTKISKWTLLLLLIPYVNAIYSLLSLFLPSAEKTKNDNLMVHILIISLFIIVMNLILFGNILGSIFLILIFLFVIFIVDVIVTNLIKLCQKHIQKNNNEQIN